MSMGILFNDPAEAATRMEKMKSGIDGAWLNPLPEERLRQCQVSAGRTVDDTSQVGHQADTGPACSECPKMGR